MCGLTLLPRNVLPTIFLLLMSMNAISFESRLTIMTTVVGSATLISAARKPTPASVASTIATAPAVANRLTFLIPLPPEIANLEACLEAYARHQITSPFDALGPLQAVDQIER